MGRPIPAPAEEDAQGEASEWKLREGREKQSTLEAAAGNPIRAGWECDWKREYSFRIADCSPIRVHVADLRLPASRTKVARRAESGVVDAAAQIQDSERQEEAEQEHGEGDL